MILPSIPTASNRTALYIVAALCAVLIALLAGGWWGWTRGYASAEHKLVSEYSSNLAEATREAMTKQQAQQAYAAGLAADLITAKRDIEAQRQSLRGRIVYVTREIPSGCGLPADAVQLWNAARRLSAPGVPQAGSPGGADGPAPAAAVAGPGQGNATVATTIADAMADHVDYVAWCEGVVAQRNKLQDLVRGWAQ